MPRRPDARSRLPTRHARPSAGVHASAALLVAATLGPLAPSGCGRPFAEGGSRELTVVTAWPADAPEILLLRAIVEREAIRIESEPAYVVRFAEPGDARAYRARNVLVVGAGALERVPAPCRRLRDLLSRDGGPYIFTPDAWLRGQSAGLVWTESRNDWMPAVARAQHRLFHALDRATFATVRSRVLTLPRDERAERRLAEVLGVRMRVPRGYRLRIDPGARAALLIEEGPPARMLRIQATRPDSAADLRRARATLARVFRPNERTLEIEEPSLTPDDLAGAVRHFNGRWEDEAVAAAGPFRAYEVTRGRHGYLVDLAVFAPGRPKLPYLRELMAIAETLEPEKRDR